MERFVCIHGHFYQPPRENPWLGVVELQDSAHPFHDWNERINAECYGPNTASRILNHENKIIDIVNNYASISFNFGPTLLTWLEKSDPAVYNAILKADKESQKRFSGHGSAIAQVYNHIIMPLADRRDKETQIIWGLRDFEARFGRKSEGMWLAETAVDIETLEILAEHQVKFTILAPNQAKRIRKIGTKQWKDVGQSKIEPKRPYLCHLPSGKKIVLFFYDGPISQELAFGPLLKNGEWLANKLLGAFVEKGDPVQLVHISTDGETYGHHHRYGDMALAYCLYHIYKNNLAQITIYGEFLGKHPPTFEVEIFENSSWSCAHGVERWKSDCGCSSGLNQGWNQKWRAPLREALDSLRSSLRQVYEQEMAKLAKDPWQARNDYINVVLDRSYPNMEQFFGRHANHFLSMAENTRMLKLLQMQKYAMFMYTSCGWFFDELSGIETVQIMLYASQAIQLAREVTGVDLEAEFVADLAKAPSNIADLQNGAKIYEQLVKPQVLDILRFGGHYAIYSLFDDYAKKADVYSFTVVSEAFERVKKEGQKLVLGRARFYSKATLEETDLTFAAAHFGGDDVFCGICLTGDSGDYAEKAKQLKALFLNNNRQAVIGQIKASFGCHNYTFHHLFHDEQRRILTKIIESALGEGEIPSHLDLQSLGFEATQLINKLLEQLIHDPTDLNLLTRINKTISPLIELKLDLWQAQNLYFSVSRKVYADMDKPWQNAFHELGSYLGVKAV